MLLFVHDHRCACAECSHYILQLSLIKMNLFALSSSQRGRKKEKSCSGKQELGEDQSPEGTYCCPHIPNNPFFTPEMWLMLMMTGFNTAIMSTKKEFLMPRVNLLSLWRQSLVYRNPNTTLQALFVTSRSSCLLLCPKRGFPPLPMQTPVILQRIKYSHLFYTVTAWCSFPMGAYLVLYTSRQNFSGRKISILFAL